jgi:hypothetical protein
MNHQQPHEVEEYGDPGIRSHDAVVPSFLKWTYIVLPFWGIITFYLFWNGPTGFTDSGYFWRQLENAAKTTFPIVYFTPAKDQENP